VQPLHARGPSQGLPGSFERRWKRVQAGNGGRDLGQRARTSGKLLQVSNSPIGEQGPWPAEEASTDGPSVQKRKARMASAGQTANASALRAAITAVSPASPAAP